MFLSWRLGIYLSFENWNPCRYLAWSPVWGLWARSNPLWNCFIICCEISNWLYYSAKQCGDLELNWVILSTSPCETVKNSVQTNCESHQNFRETVQSKFPVKVSLEKEKCYSLEHTVATSLYLQACWFAWRKESADPNAWSIIIHLKPHSISLADCERKESTIVPETCQIAFSRASTLFKFRTRHVSSKQTHANFIFHAFGPRAIRFLKPQKCTNTCQTTVFPCLCII